MGQAGSHASPGAQTRSAAPESRQQRAREGHVPEENLGVANSSSLCMLTHFLPSQGRSPILRLSPEAHGHARRDCRLL